MFLPTGIFRRQRRTQCLCGKSNLERFRNSARDNKQPAQALVNSMDPGYLAEESLAIQASGCTAFFAMGRDNLWDGRRSATQYLYRYLYKKVRSVGVAANMLRRMFASSIGGRQSLDADK